MKKNIANAVTLLNLFFGCLAIVFLLQSGLTTTSGDDGAVFIILPENVLYGSLFIFLAAVADFLDGFVARLLGVHSELGKQLDSLADVVSFGVAPAMIAYTFLRLSLAQEMDGLDVSILWFLPAFLLPLAGAYRLARFNIDNSGIHYFRGVPIPAVGLLVASFPLILLFTANATVIHILKIKWFWYATILLLSWLMVSDMPVISLKLKKWTLQQQWPVLLLIILSITGAFSIGWLTVPFIFSLYIIISIITRKSIVQND